MVVTPVNQAVDLRAFQIEMNLRKLVQLLRTFETAAQQSSRIENIYDVYLMGLQHSEG